jgi:cell wall-associated NlpC family hydrolase
MSGGILTSVSEGSSLKVRGAASNGWQPVVCGGSNGFVSSMYVTAGGSGSDSGSGTTSGSGSSKVTGSGVVSGTNGDGLRCRSGAGTGSSIITVVPEGTKVSLRGAAEGSWQPVVCGGSNGFMHSSFVSTSGGSTSGGSTARTPAPEPTTQSFRLNDGDHARVTSNLNLRYKPSTSSGVSTYAPTGTVVLITGSGAGNGYYPVNWDGLKGFMHGSFLTNTSSALSERGGSAQPNDNPPPTSDGGGRSATGNAIVDFALGYEGYPYVWATAGPASFDCSGFTYWVIKNVVGKDIGRGLWTQVSAGTPVSRNNLQPGDLVFFQNTYTTGLSHNGVYIGNGQMIHAENETTGVKISDINSSYYGSRWYGAVRFN